MLKGQKNKSLKEKINLFLYFFQYVLLILGLLLLVCHMGIFIYCVFYGLQLYYINAIIGIVLSISMVSSFFTFSKFKDARTRFKRKRRK